MVLGGRANATEQESSQKKLGKVRFPDLPYSVSWGPRLGKNDSPSIGQPAAIAEYRRGNASKIEVTM